MKLSFQSYGNDSHWHMTGYLYKMFSYNTMKLQRVFSVEISLKYHIAQYCPVLPISGSIAQPRKTQAANPAN